MFFHFFRCHKQVISFQNFMTHVSYFWNSYISFAKLRQFMKKSKGFSFLYQCFAQLRFWKSVSSKTAVAPASRFRESETLFQNRSCAKHWFKKLKPLVKIQSHFDNLKNKKRSSCKNVLKNINGASAIFNGKILLPTLLFLQMKTYVWVIPFFLGFK